MTNREKFIVDLYTAVEVLQNTLMQVGNDLDHSNDPAKAEVEALLDSVWTEVEKMEQVAIKMDSTNILVECLVERLEDRNLADLV